jgi:hypothetical protein
MYAWFLIEMDIGCEKGWMQRGDQALIGCRDEYPIHAQLWLKVWSKSLRNTQTELFNRDEKTYFQKWDAYLSVYSKHSEIPCYPSKGYWQHLVFDISFIFLEDRQVIINHCSPGNWSGL